MSSATLPTPGANISGADRMSHLEGFLDTVLRKDLDKTLRDRDTLYGKAAQCKQLRSFLKEQRRLKAQEIAEEEAVDKALGRAAANTSGASADSNAAPPSTVTAADEDSSKVGGMSVVAGGVDLLIDVGSHCYMQCHVDHPEVVHINIGCNIIVPMLHIEAEQFLQKKEQFYRDSAMRSTKEALRLKYRIRLVMEAITQLHDRQFGMGGR